MKTIIGVRLENRTEASAEFQAIITKFGCGIKTRIGLHDTYEDRCINSGLVVLEVIDDSANDLFNELCKKWECKKIEF